MFIEQKFEVCEALTGCETENEYSVYGAGSSGESTNNLIFKADERSNCLARHLCIG